MVTMQERVIRKEKRKKRLELTFKQTQIYENNCKKCLKSCEGCPIAEELQAIGRELGYQPGYDDDEIEQQELTVEEYRRLKEDKMTDEFIYKTKGWTKHRLIEWKKANNIKIRASSRSSLSSADKERLHRKLQRSKKRAIRGYDFLTVEDYMAMKQKGYTDTQVAIECGVSRSHIYKYKEHLNLALTLVVGGEENA